MIKPGCQEALAAEFVVEERLCVVRPRNQRWIQGEVENVHLDEGRRSARTGCMRPRYTRGEAGHLEPRDPDHYRRADAQCRPL